MQNKIAPTVTRYHSALIVLHWMMLCLIVAIYCLMEFRGIFPKGSDPRELMKSLHFMLGISVLLLVIFRMAIRFSSDIPAIIPAPKPIEKKLASAMHAALYLFMIFMPILGWLLLNSHGKAVPFFGFELPRLIDENKELGELLQEIHEAGGSIGYVLIGLHALAGLYHHYRRKDNTLLRMSFLNK